MALQRVAVARHARAIRPWGGPKPAPTPGPGQHTEFSLFPIFGRNVNVDQTTAEGFSFLPRCPARIASSILMFNPAKAGVAPLLPQSGPPACLTPARSEATG